MSAQERTEKATSRRRQRARDQGQFAYSQLLTSSLTLIGSFTAVFYFLSSPGGFRAFFESVMARAIQPDADLTAIVRHAGIYCLAVAAPVLIAALVAALAGNFIQGLPVSAPEAGVFKWDRLNPVQGVSRLKSRLSAAEWAKTVLLIAVAALIGWKALSGFWQQLITSPAQSVSSSNALLRSMSLHVVMYFGISVGILAVGDFFLQRWRFERSIRQTKAEVKEDMKAVEGDPIVKGRIRSIQRERAQRRMMARVKDADLIVTNPSQLAVALEYKPDQMDAPRVIAKGQDFLAQRITELGREHDIPTVENASLELLYRSVEVEGQIPVELYKPVADVLARVYRNGTRR